MLEFKRNRYGNWAAAVGQWHFQINKSTMQTDPEPYWVGAARGSKKDVKNLNTGRHRRFATLEAAVAITVTFEVAAEAFGKWIRAIADAVEAEHEMETALRWASVDNRQLYHRYRNAKKKRIRKKYAKRILEWYREEIAQ